MLISFLIFWPLFVSLVLLVVKFRSAKELALAASLIELAASLMAAVQFDKTSGVQFVVDEPWIKSLGISFSVGMDGISLLLVLLTTVLVPFIILSSFTVITASHLIFMDSYC